MSLVALELSAGRVRWSRLDAHLAASEARGIPSTYVICSTPAFAAIPVVNQPRAIVGGTTNCPPKLTDFADFVAAIVTRYKGRIAVYEGRNECNYTGFWCGTGTPTPPVWTVTVTDGGTGYTSIPDVDIQGVFTFGGVARSVRIGAPDGRVRIRQSKTLGALIPSVKQY